MAKPLTIGELARAADVPTSTVRYYERQGILRPRRRSYSNYRLYSQDDVHRLRFIRAAQATGFTLNDVTELLRPAGCHRVQGLIEERLETVAARMNELRHVQRVLRASLRECREHEQTGRCRVIDSLSASATARRP
jgi:MerR family mercuric resistance operon transcriptional regulator